MSYWQLYDHLVWSTKKKQRLITPQVQPLLYAAMAGKCAGLDGVMHAIGGMLDRMMGGLATDSQPRPDDK